MFSRKCLLPLVFLYTCLAHADFEIDKHRFTICNDTPIVVNIALQQHVESAHLLDMHVIGWYQVQPNTCLPMGMVESNLGIYAYGMKSPTQVVVFVGPNLSPYDDGGNKFCVKPYKFDFKGFVSTGCEDSERRIFHTYSIDDEHEVWRINAY